MRLRTVSWSELESIFPAVEKVLKDSELKAFLQGVSDGGTSGRLIFLLTAGFSDDIVRDGKLNTDAIDAEGDDAIAFKRKVMTADQMPIGIPLNRSLQITNDLRDKNALGMLSAFRPEESVRTIIYPGEAFGLWENITEIEGAPVGKRYERLLREKYLVKAGCVAFLPFGRSEAKGKERWLRPDGTASEELDSFIENDAGWADDATLRKHMGLLQEERDTWTVDIILIEAKTLPLELRHAFAVSTVQQLIVARSMLLKRLEVDYDLSQSDGDAAVARTVTLARQVAAGVEHGYYCVSNVNESENANLLERAERDLPIRLILRRWTSPDSKTAVVFVPCMKSAEVSAIGNSKLYRVPQVCGYVGTGNPLKVGFNEFVKLYADTKNRSSEKSRYEMNERLAIAGVEPATSFFSQQCRNLETNKKQRQTKERVLYNPDSHGPTSEWRITNEPDFTMRLFYNAGPRGINDTTKSPPNFAPWQWLPKAYARGEQMFDTSVPTIPRSVNYLLQIDMNATQQRVGERSA